MSVVCLIHSSKNALLDGCEAFTRELLSGVTQCTNTVTFVFFRKCWCNARVIRWARNTVGVRWNAPKRPPPRPAAPCRQKGTVSHRVRGCDLTRAVVKTRVLSRMAANGTRFAGIYLRRGMQKKCDFYRGWFYGCILCCTHANYLTVCAMQAMLLWTTMQCPW